MTPGLPFLLSVHRLTKRYGKTLILAGVDFDLQPGEILGIIGPNGAGKTPLMECLVGLLPVDEGEVFFHGAPMPIMRRREAMFYLPDGITPWSDQPVYLVRDQRPVCPHHSAPSARGHASRS